MNKRSSDTRHFNERSRRIGLFGGTFNPIHIGHLRSGEEMAEAFRMEKVIFVPAAIPPHKVVHPLASAAHRFKMVEIATETNPAFSASDVELRREGKSYSIETITHFRNELGRSAELYFIMGMDSFLEITTWSRYEEILELCSFIVTTRPGYRRKALDEILPVAVALRFCYDEQDDRYLHATGHAIHFSEITDLAVSSTWIRDELRRGRRVRYLLPDGVLRYIEQNNLYSGK